MFAMSNFNLPWSKWNLSYHIVFMHVCLLKLYGILLMILLYGVEFEHYIHFFNAVIQWARYTNVVSIWCFMAISLLVICGIRRVICSIHDHDLVLLQVKEEAQQLALIFETVGAFKVKRKGGKGKQIFGRWVEPESTQSSSCVCFFCLSLYSLTFACFCQCYCSRSCRHYQGTTSKVPIVKSLWGLDVNKHHNSAIYFQNLLH